jgi:hypothetical protein
MQTLISFHGDQKIKDKYLKRLRLHYDADEIIKGTYWKKGKGCAVGCTIHSGKHDSFETELGISWRLALLEDSLFEKLPNEEAKEFPLQFLNSMPVGVDTNIIFKKFILWNLVDEKEGLIYHIKGEKEISLLKKVADTYRRSFTEEISEKKWKALADEAYSASAFAYTSAFASASASTSAFASASASASAYASAFAFASAYASAFASAYASAFAFASAYASAFAYANWRQKFDERIIKMRDKLLELMIESGSGEKDREDITK